MKRKHTLMASAALAMTLAGGAVLAHGYWSEDRSHGPYNMGSGMGPGMGPGMMGQQGNMLIMGMSPDSLSDEELDLMADQIRDMHISMTRIANAEGRDERRGLVRDHLKAMQAMMQRRHEVMHGLGAGRNGNWRHDLEERVRHMEEMMKQQ